MSLEESSCEKLRVQKDASFSEELKYKYFEQGSSDECEECPEEDNSAEVFDHYLNRHCEDVPHITYYKAVWKALRDLHHTTAEHKTARFCLPPALEMANYRFIKELGTLDPDMTRLPLEMTEQTTPRQQRDRGISTSTDAVRGKLGDLDEVLRGLSTTSKGKEEEIVERIGDYVDTTKMLKETEHFVITGTKGARGWDRPRVRVVTEQGMAGARDIGKANIDGRFHTIRHGQVPYGAKTRPATLIALDLTIQSPKRSSIDQAIIEITYKDTPWGSQEGLMAYGWYQPDMLAGPKNGCLITKEWVLAPEATINGFGGKLGSFTDIKKYNQDDNCWNIQGITKPVKNLARQHRWTIDGDDTRKFTVPHNIRLGFVVMHELKPFNIEIRIEGSLRGMWTNGCRYLAQLEPYHADEFLMEPKECLDLLEEKDLKTLVLEKNQQYILEQPVKKLIEALQEWLKKQEHEEEMKRMFEEFSKAL